MHYNKKVNLLVPMLKSQKCERLAQAKSLKIAFENLLQKW